MGEGGGDGVRVVGLGDGGRSDVEKDLRFRLEARARRVATEDCAARDNGRRVAREDCSVMGQRTWGICVSLFGEMGSALSRKEAGTGQPDASTVMPSHAGGTSLSAVVVQWFNVPQPAQSFVSLLSKFSWLLTKGAS